jgi:FG-GAP-like repeat
VTQNFGTGTPRSVYVGDFNNDGKLDVLVWTYANLSGAQNQNVYELLGNGDGTFGPAKLVLSNFGYFTVADLNHDGLPDIVEYNEPLVITDPATPVGISVYLCQPDGSFQFSQTYQVYSDIGTYFHLFDNGQPQQSLSPMVADFNGDGNPDIAVFQSEAGYSQAQSYLQILAGNGDGTFTPTYSVTQFHKSAIPTTAADVTGDGRADLLEVDGWPSSFHVIPAVPGPNVQLALASQPIVGPSGALIVNLSLVPSVSTTVQLSASDPNIHIPSSVAISAGTLSASVPFTIGSAFDSSRVFSISAQLGGQTATIYSYQTTQALAGIRLFTNATKEATPPSGTTPDYAIGMVSIGGYSTTAQLSCQGLPAGAACIFGINPLPISAGGSVGDSLSIQTSASTPIGSFTIVVVATDGAVSDQMKLVLNVADFTVSVTPSSVTVVTGAVANFSLQLGAVGDWTDLVNLSCTLSGPTTTGCNFAGSYLPGNIPFSIATSSLAPGNYNLNVTGFADGVTHSATTAVLHVQGATGTVSPASANVSVGGSATFNVTVSSANGYSDQFTFSCPNAPAGVSCSFNPPTGALAANGNLAAVLTVTVSSRPAVLPVVPGRRHFPWLPVTMLCTGLILVFAWSARQATVPVRQWKAVAGAFLSIGAIALAITIVSCGGGGSSTSSGPPPPPPPPQPVTVTLTVQAASPSLTVNAGTITIQVQ